MNLKWYSSSWWGCRDAITAVSSEILSWRLFIGPAAGEKENIWKHIVVRIFHSQKMPVHVNTCLFPDADSPSWVAAPLWVAMLFLLLRRNPVINKGRRKTET